MINPDKYLKYLAETDEPCAKAKSLMKSLEHALKTVEATEFLRSDGTQEAKKSSARASQAYRDMIDKIHEATLDYETMNNKRKTAEMCIEVFRSQNANMRKGNI